jgi:hypothetical protein
MEVHLRVNTLLLLNLNAFFLKKVFYYMKVIIIWNIFAEFGKKKQERSRVIKKGKYIRNYL